MIDAKFYLFVVKQDQKNALRRLRLVKKQTLRGAESIENINRS